MSRGACATAGERIETESLRVLFISEYFFGDPSTEASGVVRPMNMLIDAASRIGQVDLLFYVHGEIDLSAASTAGWQRALAEPRGGNVALSVCRQLEHAERLPLGELLSVGLDSLANGALSFFTRMVSLRTSGSEQVRALEAHLDRRPDLIVAHRLGVMAPLLRTRRPLPPIVFDLDDVEHVRYGRIMRRCPSRRRPGLDHAVVVGLLWLQYALTLPLLLWAEYRAVRLARCTFVCSEKDRALVGKWGVGNVVAVPNAVAVRAPGAPVGAPTLLFVGNYAYRPNVDAVEFLIDVVWPRIRSAKPQARLLIAGPRPERIAARGVRDPAVELLGYVQDLDALYGRARVVVCPIRAGSGTRLKIIEAAAYAKPVVSTTLGAEGLEMTDGLSIVLRDDAASFAAACVELLSDLASCRRIGEQARRCVLERHERTRIVDAIADRLRTTARLATAAGAVPKGAGPP
jgi:glycosyltransferase involved in cell wall biosynthesis